MPIPDPTTPKDSAVSCHHGGPSLPTPNLKPYSLSGGDGKNEIMFVKSRSGNLICFDDKDKTLRFQDKTGNAEIRMTRGVIEIKHKTGDINWSSAKETRWDCVTFEVHTTEDISFSAGTDITLTCGEMKTKSGKNTSFSAEKPITFISWNTHKATTMEKTTATGKKQVSVGTKSGNQTYTAMQKIKITAKQDLGILSKAALTMVGVMGCDFKSNDKITLEAAAIMTGMSMCININ
jgi:hypothetical protein